MSFCLELFESLSLEQMNYSISLNPSADAYFAKSQVLADSQFVGDALDQLHRALELDPSHASSKKAFSSLMKRKLGGNGVEHDEEDVQLKGNGSHSKSYVFEGRKRKSDEISK